MGGLKSMVAALDKVVNYWNKLEHSKSNNMTTKPLKVVTYNEGLLSNKSHDSLITWYSNFDSFYTIYLFKAVQFCKHELSIFISCMC